MADDIAIMSPPDACSREALAEGLLHLFKPAIQELDSKVHNVRQSQVELRTQIDALTEDLHKLQELQEIPLDLEPYVKKLMNSRRRIMLVNNILQNAQVQM
ncbi:hypothetical protein QZH41_018935 [Actinostola sp. cb2023]|nr:hypothetical protein QZH41_018935 [Actinostola sp. cb2023]